MAADVRYIHAADAGWRSVRAAATEFIQSRFSRTCVGAAALRRGGKKAPQSRRIRRLLEYRETTVQQRPPKSDLSTKDIATSGLTLPEKLRRIGRAVDATFLAHILGVSRLLIYKRARTGRIPCFRIGGAVRFDPAIVARWLEAQ